MNFPCSGQGQCQYGMWIGPEVLGSDISRLALSPPPMTTLTTAGRIPTKNCAGEQIWEQLNKFWKCAESKYNLCPWAGHPGWVYHIICGRVSLITTRSLIALTVADTGYRQWCSGWDQPIRGQHSELVANQRPVFSRMTHGRLRHGSVGGDWCQTGDEGHGRAPHSELQPHET